MTTMSSTAAAPQDLSELSFYPIQYPELLELRDRQQNVHWTAKIIDYRGDRTAWDTLDHHTREYIKFLLFLFAQLDGIVNENLIRHFKEETSFIKECKYFYAIQEEIETIHNETYSLLIMAFVRDIEEQKRGLNSIAHFPSIRAIADWSFRWMDPSLPLTERIIAFACIEGIIFSSAFAGIYWIKRRNILHGLTIANEYIARDEAIHTEFAIALYHLLTSKINRFPLLSDVRVTEIIRSAVDVTEQFTRHAMGLSLVGLDADEMMQYVHCTADRLASSLGTPSIYQAANPFHWMKVIGLPNKSNFFERKVTVYTKEKTSDFTFDLDTPF